VTALPALAPAYPELWLALSAMALLMFGVFRCDGSTRTVSWLAVLALLIGVALVATQPAGSVLTFGGLFVSDGFGPFCQGPDPARLGVFDHSLRWGITATSAWSGLSIPC
jgi:hypothetical protein